MGIFRNFWGSLNWSPILQVFLHVFGGKHLPPHLLSFIFCRGGGGVGGGCGTLGEFVLSCPWHTRTEGGGVVPWTLRVHVAAKNPNTCRS